VILRLAVLVQYWRVTDGWMDGQTHGDSIYSASIVSRGKNWSSLRETTSNFVSAKPSSVFTGVRQLWTKFTLGFQHKYHHHHHHIIITLLLLCWPRHDRSVMRWCGARLSTRPSVCLSHFPNVNRAACAATTSVSPGANTRRGQRAFPSK